MPSLTIDTVLFDADGVLQYPTIDFGKELAAFVDPPRPDQPGTVEDFLRDVMTAETPSIAGQGDFGEALAGVLHRWHSSATPADVLALWRHFEAEPEVVDLIQRLRKAGVKCHLATNQQAYRLAIMRDERHYGDWFDQTFYSSEMGVAKPDPAYFRAILEAVGRPAEKVLFIDDNAANITGARSVGLHAEQFELESGVEVLRDLLRSYSLPVG